MDIRSNNVETRHQTMSFILLMHAAEMSNNACISVAGEGIIVDVKHNDEYMYFEDGYICTSFFTVLGTPRTLVDNHVAYYARACMIQYVLIFVAGL